LPSIAEAFSPQGASMIRKYLLAAVATLALAVPATLSAQTPRTYRVEDLGTFGGFLLTGLAINSSGEIAGTAFTADGGRRAFRWTPHRGLEDLGTNGGTEARGLAINDRGDVVGFYTDQDGMEHPFIAEKHHRMRS
jgi:probable HAF family extracellular repeat protein